MNIQQFIEKLRWFEREAVCPVRSECIPGFVSGAYWGWGEARQTIGKWIGQVQVSSLPTSAVCFFRDGEQMCAVFGDFINLQCSPAGFGGDFEEALADLHKNARHTHVASEGDIDKCNQCGLDIRNEIHLRMNENVPSVRPPRD